MHLKKNVNQVLRHFKIASNSNFYNFKHRFFKQSDQEDITVLFHAYTRSHALQSVSSIFNSNVFVAQERTCRLSQCDRKKGLLNTLTVGCCRNVSLQYHVWFLKDKFSAWTLDSIIL